MQIFGYSSWFYLISVLTGVFCGGMIVAAIEERRVLKRLDKTRRAVKANRLRIQRNAEQIAKNQKSIEENRQCIHEIQCASGAPKG